MSLRLVKINFDVEDLENPWHEIIFIKISGISNPDKLRRGILKF